MIKKVFTILMLTGFLMGCVDTSGPTVSARVRPMLGNANAPVLIEEFSDLQCPACGFISPQVEDIVRKNPTIARMQYFHFPLTQHQNAYPAAEASECAADQGKFWDYVDLTFENQDKLNQDLFYSMAKTLSLDEARFKTCLDGREKKATVKADLQEGYRRNVRATPTIYVNGKEARFTSPETFEKFIRAQASPGN